MPEFVPVIWVDHISGTTEGTTINKERLDQMQTQYKLTAGTRTLAAEPADPKEGDWYYDSLKNAFRIFSGGWKTILWAGSTLIQNKPLKWDGAGVATGEVSMSDVAGLDSALAVKADTSLLNAISAEKVDKVPDMGLSANDYTDGDRNKLAGIEENANNTTIQSAWPSPITDETVPSTKLVRDSLDSIPSMQEILQAVYPIGSIYMSSVATDPSVLLRFGTWKQYARGRTIIGEGTSDQTFVKGSEGGSSKVALSLNNIPSHNHYYTPSGNLTLAQGEISEVGLFNESASRSGIVEVTNIRDLRYGGATTTRRFANVQVKPTGSFSGNRTQTENSGSGALHENLPPYIVTYIWERTG